MGTIERVEKIRIESDLKESELYIELQRRIKVVESLESQPMTEADHGQERRYRIEKDIELLKNNMLSRKVNYSKQRPVKLRAIALGR